MPENIQPSAQTETSASVPAEPASTAQAAEAPASQPSSLLTDPPAADAPAPDADKPAEAPKETPKPIEYTPFQAPEGVALDEAFIGEFAEVAKADGLTQEQAQKYVDLGIKQSQNMVKAVQDHIAAQSKTWEAEVRADKDIGGDKLAANLAVAQRALSTFDKGGEVKALLDRSGLGNNPAIIRMFVAAGNAISEDRIGAGQAEPKAQPRSAASILYPDHK